MVSKFPGTGPNVCQEWQTGPVVWQSKTRDMESGKPYNILKKSQAWILRRDPWRYFCSHDYQFLDPPPNEASDAWLGQTWIVSNLLTMTWEELMALRLLSPTWLFLPVVMVTMYCSLSLAYVIQMLTPGVNMSSQGPISQISSRTNQCSSLDNARIRPHNVSVFHDGRIRQSEWHKYLLENGNTTGLTNHHVFLGGGSRNCC